MVACHRRARRELFSPTPDGPASRWCDSRGYWAVSAATVGGVANWLAEHAPAGLVSTAVGAPYPDTSDVTDRSIDFTPADRSQQGVVYNVVKKDDGVAIRAQVAALAPPLPRRAHRSCRERCSAFPVRADGCAVALAPVSAASGGDFGAGGPIVPRRSSRGDIPSQHPRRPRHSQNRRHPPDERSDARDVSSGARSAGAKR